MAQDGEREARGQCASIWRVLVARTSRAMLITYDELSKETGIDFQRIRTGDHLERVHNFCNAHQLGPLDSLVVTANGRVPGEGYFTDRRNEGANGTDQEILAADHARVRHGDYSHFQDPGWEAFVPVPALAQD